MSGSAVEINGGEGPAQTAACAPLPAAAEPEFAALLGYWRSLCREGLLPSRADIDPLDMPPACLPHIILIEEVDGGRRFCYRLVGAAFRFSASGLGSIPYVDEVFVHTAYAEAQQALFRRVLKDGRPRYFEVDVHFRERVGTCTVRRLALPLRAAPPHGAMILGLQRWGDRGRNPAPLPWTEALYWVDRIEFVPA